MSSVCPTSRLAPPWVVGSGCVRTPAAVMAVAVVGVVAFSCQHCHFSHAFLFSAGLLPCASARPKSRGWAHMVAGPASGETGLAAYSQPRREERAQQHVRYVRVLQFLPLNLPHPCNSKHSIDLSQVLPSPKNTDTLQPRPPPCPQILSSNPPFNNGFD